MSSKFRSRRIAKFAPPPLTGIFQPAAFHAASGCLPSPPGGGLPGKDRICPLPLPPGRRDRLSVGPGPEGRCRVEPPSEDGDEECARAPRRTAEGRPCLSVLNQPWATHRDTVTGVGGGRCLLLSRVGFFQIRGLPPEEDPLVCFLCIE